MWMRWGRHRVEAPCGALLALPSGCPLRSTPAPPTFRSPPALPSHASQYVDWSDSVPARDKRYPPINKLGDMSTEVRCLRLLLLW